MKHRHGELRSVCPFCGEEPKEEPRNANADLLRRIADHHQYLDECWSEWVPALRRIANELDGVPMRSPILGDSDCLYVHDGTDTDGSEWWYCFTHDAQAPSPDAPCDRAPWRKCPQCNSGDIDGPDTEGLYDCLGCGIWFDPAREEAGR